MKTRTNQTISMLVVASMVSLTTAQINTLSAGDIVLKKDESGYHSYLVSYKKQGTGICLTYTDASCVETVSYDLTGGEWVYNSTDITPLGVSGTKLYNHHLHFFYDGLEVNFIFTSNSPTFSFSALKDKTYNGRNIIGGYVYTDNPQTGVLVNVDKSITSGGLNIQFVGLNDDEMGVIYITIANADLDDETLELTDNVVEL